MIGSRGILGVLVVLLLAPTAAVAATHRHRYLAPPGNSAVSQYLEVVPSASGNATEHLGGPPGGGGGGPAGGGLSASERARLSHDGTAGQTLESVVAATTPPPVKPRHQAGVATRHGSRSAPAPGWSLRPQSVGSPVASVLGAATGSADGGVGPLLPIAMLSALAVVAAAVLRRRAR